jgi:cyclohexa-1,5-dienecarbonyl-CoA hydratase
MTPATNLVHVTASPLGDGIAWRVTFGGAKGNILDGALMSALRRVLAGARDESNLKAICLEGAGRHFSFGASIEEHLPAQVAAMLDEFRGLVFDLLTTDVVTIAAVSGRCLGGGLEVVSLCHRVVAAHDAIFGQPEIALGVFAPVASVVLPARIGRPAAEDLCLTGRLVPSAEARALGLVDEIAGEPAAAALAWARTHFAARSASSLRLAVRAVRASLVAKLRTELPALEAIYLDELMRTHDATEGLTAFLEKRPAAWRHA